MKLLRAYQGRVRLPHVFEFAPNFLVDRSSGCSGQNSPVYRLHGVVAGVFVGSLGAVRPRLSRLLFGGRPVRRWLTYIAFDIVPLLFGLAGDFLATAE